MYDEAEKIFLMFYAIGKDFIGFEPNAKRSAVNVTGKALSIILAVLLLLGACIIFLPIILFYLCLNQLLKFKHGALYGGFLNGPDTIFETTSCKIDVILIFSCTDEPTILIKKLIRCAYRMHTSNYKFNSKILRLFGYGYYLKDQVPCEDVIHVLRYNDNEYMTKEDLNTYLEDNCLPLEDYPLWKAVFFSQPIRWHTHNVNNKQIAVVLTFKHALGDFPSLISFIRKHFKLTETIPRSANLSTVEYSTQNKRLTLDNVCVLRNILKVPFRAPTLNTCNYSKCHVATFIEERREYLPKIKKMKQKLNTTFVEILSAAISASISKYFEQQNIQRNDMTFGIVVRPLTRDIPELINKTYNFENLANNSGIIIFDIPFKLKDETIISRTKYMRHLGQLLKHSVDPSLLYTSMLYVNSFLPIPVTSFLHDIFVKDMSGCISNVIGIPQSRVWDNPIDDIFFFAPHFVNSGFTFFVFSYDDRLQMTVVTKKGFLRNREDLQEVLDNVFKNIDELINEILI